MTTHLDTRRDHACLIVHGPDRPGIVAAALFSLVASFENLELNLLLVGPGRVTLPVAMLSYLEFRMDLTWAAVATVQIALIAAMMLITDRFVKLSRVV